MMNGAERNRGNEKRPCFIFSVFFFFCIFCVSAVKSGNVIISIAQSAEDVNCRLYDRAAMFFLLALALMRFLLSFSLLSELHQ